MSSMKGVIAEWTQGTATRFLLSQGYVVTVQALIGTSSFCGRPGS